MTPKENEKIFINHFKNAMVLSDYNAFKKRNPTLFRCILSAMDESNLHLKDEIKQLEMRVEELVNNEG